MVEKDNQHPAPSLSKTTPIGFIGAGRLGSSLAIAMERAGYRVSGVSSRRSSHRHWLTSQLPGTSVHSDGVDVAARASIVFITTPDSVIKETADSISWRPDHSVLHCSGAATLEQLDSAVSASAAVAGFHPLQTFPTPNSANSFTGITFGIESADEPLLQWLSALATDLGGQAFPVTAEQRPAYHAAAVMACGLLAGLTGLAAEVWASTGGISREEAVVSLTPLVKMTANSMGENGLPKALTGPYVRGDVVTVLAHVKATSSVSAELGMAYAALAAATLHIAKEQGNLTAEAEKSIREILTNTLQSNCEKIDEA